jgi:hydrogenase maturation protein HypF
VAPLIRAIVNDLQQKIPVSHIAGRFHYSLAEMLAQACMQVGAQTELRVVALSGGVFQNQLLLELLIERLEAMGFQVYINRLVPPNDGGISLGQLAIAASRLLKDK